MWRHRVICPWADAVGQSECRMIESPYYQVFPGVTLFRPVVQSMLERSTNGSLALGFQIILMWSTTRGGFITAIVMDNPNHEQGALISSEC